MAIARPHASSPARPRQFIGLVGFTCVLLLLGGCIDTIEVRGHVPNERATAQITAGTQSKQQVATLLGSPSTVAPFDPNIWIYINEKTKRVAFYEPEVVERNILLVEFDEAGVVQELRRYTAADGKTIEPVDRITPTAGKELTFLQQLFGNLGRFNRPMGQSGN